MRSYENFTWIHIFRHAAIKWFALAAALLLLLSLFLSVGERTKAQEEKEWRFGVVEAYTAPNSARELDIAWTRVRFHWAEAQKGGTGTWTPEVSDEQIANELAAGRLVVGLLIGIPDWARDEDDLPQGLWLDYDDPDNTWGIFVRETVQRYAGQIDHWVIWNEPDIDKTAVAHSWDGGVEDFYQLQRVAYLNAKEVNPEAVIHLSAFTYWADVYADREQYLARLLDKIVADPEAAEHNYYFDKATAHLYFQPDQIYDLLQLFQEVMKEHGIDKPIWLMETNAPPHDDPAWPVAEHTLSVMQDEQAAFMPQALVSAMAAGAERIGVYKMMDIPDDRQANPEPFGLLRIDGSRRPAFRALHVAMQQLTGAQQVTRERWDAVGQFRVRQQDRETMVLFARLADPQQVEVEAIAERARLVDLRGTEQLVEAQDGRYVLELPPALCMQTIGDYCMIGGSTFYLIQALDGGDPPGGIAPALPQPTTTPTSMPTATPTPTVTPTKTPVPPTTTPSPPPLATTARITETPATSRPPGAATQVSALVVEDVSKAAAGNEATAVENSSGSWPAIFAGLLALGFLLLVAWWLFTTRHP
ncbi:MAG: hypothetical protein R3293_10205 [Candidatus Promineifilaceae bacterium]|nr:hypothetical protein [Candidatus Promineifilaceae bacterium]